MALPAEGRRRGARVCGDHIAKRLAGSSGKTWYDSAARDVSAFTRIRRHRCGHSAVPGGRSGRLGADRAAALAQGLQHRLQVHRQARRGGRPHPGRVPEDLQVARHLRPARQFSDLARQRQPQPVHRPLPERAQGARDHRPRRRSGQSDAGVADHQSVCRTRAGRPRRPAQEGDGRTWRRRCARRCCCATSRNCRIRRSPTGSTCRKAPSSPASIADAPNSRGRFDVCGTSSKPESQDEPDHRTPCRRRDRPGRRTADDVSAARGFFRRRGAAAGRRPSQAAARLFQGHLRRQRHHRLPDGPLSPDRRPPAARSRSAACRSASRRC